MIDSFILTFHKVQGTNNKFIGLDNYKRLLSDKFFLIALKNTLFFFFAWLPVQIFFSLLVSVLLNQRRLRGKGFFRTCIFLPCVTSLVAYSLVFKNIFSGDGLINAIVLKLGLSAEPIPWLTDPTCAKIVTIIALTWRWIGYDVIFYLSGLQNISYDLYEAADIDGASFFRKFWSITLLLLKPVILFCMISNTIGILQLFDEPMNLTGGGGPGSATYTLSLYIYKQSFEFKPNFGYAATISYVVMVIIALLSLIQFKFAGDDHEN